MEFDIAPELYEAIQKDFEELISVDKQLQGILEKIEKGTATHLETQMYAQRIGECAATAIKNNLSEGLLPGGKLYYNIAERTIRPTLEHNHELVMDVASQIQQHLNTAAGLGIKPVVAPLDVERVERVVNAAVYADSFEVMQSELGEAIINTTQSFADDFIQQNVDFQARSGMSPKITRISTGKCCDWCEKLAGTYDYKSLPDNSIFQRHKYCRCIVLYDPGKGKYQNVHTKKWSDSTEPDDIEKRKQIGLHSPDTFRPKDYASTIGRYVNVNRAAVEAAAKAGTRHPGVYTDAVRKTKKQLQDSIVSRVAQVERHADKIKNPSSYILEWDYFDPRKQKGTLHVWEKDMRRNAEQAEIELAVFEARFGK